jgi:glycosidase
MVRGLRFPALLGGLMLLGACQAGARPAHEGYDAGGVPGTSDGGRGPDVGPRADGPRVRPDGTSGDLAGTDSPASDVSDGQPAADAPAAGDAGAGGMPAQADRAVWRQRTIYLVMLDRFANGDAGNDQLGLAGCFDPTDPHAFHGGDLAGLRQRIPYLTELGVDVVWVTPLARQALGPSGSPCPYHGYWADYTDPDDGALEPRFGTANELTGLIADLDTAGIRFVLDMVVNHPGDHARIVSQHPDWFHPPDTCAQLGDPAIYCPYRAGISDFAQERPEVATYLDDLSAGWVQRFALDGIRMDTAKYVLPSYFHDHWVPAVRAVRGDLFLVGEVFSETRSDLVPYLDAGFDSVFHFPRRAALRDAFARGGSVDLVASAVRSDLDTFGLERTLDLVTLLDNHDVKRFVNEPGLSVPEAEIARRYRLALAALFTAPGIPQLYMGDELGLYGGDDPDNRRDLPAWAWDASSRAGTHPGVALPGADTLFSYVQALIALRRSAPALHTGGYTELWRQNGAANANVWAFFRGTGDSRAIVVINAGTASSGTLSIPIAGNSALPPADRAALADGTVLRDGLGYGAPPSVTLSGGTLSVDMPGSTVAVYR